MSDVKLKDLIDGMSGLEKLCATNLKNLVMSRKLGMLKREILEHVEEFQKVQEKAFKEAGAVTKTANTKMGPRSYYTFDDDAENKTKAVNDSLKDTLEDTIELPEIPKITLDMLKKEEHTLTPNDFLALSWLIEE